MKRFLFSFFTLSLFATHGTAQESLTSYPNLPLCSEYGCTYPLFNSKQYENALKGVAFRECLNDYELSYGKTAKERTMYFKSIGTNDGDVSGVLNGRYKNIDFINEINPMLKLISDKCYKVAKAYGTKMPYIDYNKGARLGWYVNAIVSIKIRKCLESDPTISKIQTNEYSKFANSIPGFSLITEYDVQLAEKSSKYNPNSKLKEKQCNFTRSHLKKMIGEGLISD